MVLHKNYRAIGADLPSLIHTHRPNLTSFEEIYKDVHQHPELGTLEVRTASLIATHLKSLNLKVVDKIGGNGVVGILANGSGPTLLLRADIDALPILEKTGLEYASKVEMKDWQGVLRPVMHACGHDTHVASMLAVATLLSSAKKEWSGTVLFCFQPDEEHGAGARAMVEDKLYDKVPKPDIVLGQHVTQLKTGVVAIRDGAVMAAADSFDVRIFGRGGHGSQPQNTIDPVVIASYIVVRLQSIVSREVTPGELAVLTCGSIHGGETENVIPDFVDLKLNLRTYNASVRERTIASIKRIINAECEASGVETKPSIKATTSFPVTINSPEIVEPLIKTWKTYFGENLWDMGQNLASEDVSIFATSIGVPYAYWYFGGTDAKQYDDAKKQGKLSSLIPGNHSSHFAPVIEPTLRTAVDAMALAALTFLNVEC